jgi:hypothetical protein
MSHRRLRLNVWTCLPRPASADRSTPVENRERPTSLRRPGSRTSTFNRVKCRCVLTMMTAGANQTPSVSAPRRKRRRGLRQPDHFGGNSLGGSRQTPHLRGRDRHGHRFEVKLRLRTNGPTACGFNGFVREQPCGHPRKPHSPRRIAADDGVRQQTCRRRRQRRQHCNKRLFERKPKEGSSHPTRQRDVWQRARQWSNAMRRPIGRTRTRQRVRSHP